MTEAIDLSRLLSPRATAVVGASEDRMRIGGQPVHSLTAYGYRGAVYPVNPRHELIQGLKCYPDVGSVPRPCDVAVIVLPAEQVPQAIEQCGAAGIPFAIVLSAGFTEVGNDELQARLATAIRTSGVRVIGPNCTGLLNLKDKVFNGFGAGFRNPDLKRGPLAMVSQSGGFGYSIVAYAEDQGVGFDYMISTGNEADLTSLNVIGHLLEDPDVEMIVSYMEGIKDGRHLRRLGARALELSKPIVIWKVGNTDAGARAALSHTANLTARYELYQAAFRAGGFIEIADMHELVDIVQAFRGRRLPAGNRVGVLTTSGGAGVLLADRCTQLGLTLPQPHASTGVELRKLTPSFAALENPLDLSAALAQNADTFNAATGVVVADPDFDMTIVRSFPGADVEGWARGLIRLTQATQKPVLICMSGLVDRTSSAIRILEDNAIPYFPTPGRTAIAAAALHSFSLRQRLCGKPAAARAVESRSLPLPAGAAMLSEREAKVCLTQYGVAAVREIAVSSAEIAALSELPFDFPVVVKIDSRDVPHKTEANAVRVGVKSLDEVKRVAGDIITATRRFNPSAVIDGVLVQEMAAGLEMIVGGVNDPVFGPYVVVGMGGIMAEVLRDKTIRYAPFDTATAHEMIGELKVARILRGYRGTPPYDIDALADTVSRISYMLSDHPDTIDEIDVNPLFVRREGAGIVAADCLIALKKESA